MAKIYRQIGSLTEFLDKMGGSEILTLDDVSKFKNELSKNISKAKDIQNVKLMEQIDQMKENLAELAADLESQLKDRERLLNEEISGIEAKINHILVLENKKMIDKLQKKSKFKLEINTFVTASRFNIWHRLQNFLKNFFLIRQKKHLLCHFSELLMNPYSVLTRDISLMKSEIAYKEQKFDKLVADATQSEIERLKMVEMAIDENKMFYLGAIGEQKILDELKKLPDSYVVINDFKKSFSRPIYYENNDWICSVQIDHLVIGPTGLFIIETKNWSRNSINNANLFSPVKQILRANRALFSYLNQSVKYLNAFRNNGVLQKIAPTNILALLQYIPFRNVRHVKIVLPDILLRHIVSGTSIFHKEQVEELTNFLINSSDA